MLLLLHLDRLMLLQGKRLALLLHRRLLTLQVLRFSLIARLHRRRGVNVAIGHKRLADGHARRTAVVHTGKLIPIGTGNMRNLQLRPHGRSVLFVACCKLGRSGSHL
jgi:hypothetical protein